MHARLTYRDEHGLTVNVEVDAESPVTLGRSRDNRVVLRDELASRVHARIHYDAGQWWVRNFGRNGTRINGAKIEADAPLKHGDQVRIGSAALLFLISDEADDVTTVEEPPEELPVNLNDLERWAVGEALRRTSGNKSAAASLLGISRDTVHVKCERFGIGKAKPASA